MFKWKLKELVFDRDYLHYKTYYRSVNANKVKGKAQAVAWACVVPRCSSINYRDSKEYDVWIDKCSKCKCEYLVYKQ